LNILFLLSLFKDGDDDNVLDVLLILFKVMGGMVYLLNLFENPNKASAETRIPVV